MARFYPSIDGFSLCWSCKIISGLSFGFVAGYVRSWRCLGSLFGCICVSCCRCCLFVSFVCSPLNLNLNSKSWLQMIGFESLFVNKKMDLNIFGSKPKNYNFHEKCVNQPSYQGFFNQRFCIHTCIYIYIYLCVCVFVFWRVAIFACFNNSVGCFRKAESRDVESRDPEVRSVVLAEQVCMCTLANWGPWTCVSFNEQFNNQQGTLLFKW